MILSLITIGAVLAIAYIWGSRGFFSALIHMLCVVASGAIAFALWEPVSQMIIKSGASGSQWMIDVGYGVGLAVPFALSLAVLRLATNGIIRKNVDLDGATNMIGGAVCGVISGILTAGIGVLAVSSLRVESSILGWQPIVTGNNGSLEYAPSQLWVPVDRMTGWFYSQMSDSTFRVEDNLAKWHPNVADEGALLRLNYDEGKSKNVIPADAYEVLGHYTLDPKDAKEVLNDTFEATKKRQYNYIDGTPATPGQITLEGYCVKFKSAANEKSGRVIVGNSQVSLIVEQDGKSKRIQPVAVISEAENAKSIYSRWPFEGQKSFIATFNGRNDSPMSFEFPVPKGAKPLALYVKGQRTRLDTDQVGRIATYDSIAARDAAIASKAIVPTSGRLVLKFPPTMVKSNPAKWPAEPPLRVSDALPYGVVLQRDDAGGLTIEGTGRSSTIAEGEAKFKNERIRGRETDPALQVRKFSVAEDVAIIQLTVDGKNTEFGFLSAAAGNIDRSKPPVLVDDNGTQYDCYGYVYRTQSETWIRYTPESALTAVSQVPAITRSQPDDRMVFLYRVGKTVKIKYFAVGDEAVVEFDKPFAVSR